MEREFHLSPTSNYLPAISWLLCEVLDARVDLEGLHYPFNPDVSESAYFRLLDASIVRHIH